MTATGGIPPDLMRRARQLTVELVEPGAYRVTGGREPHFVQVVSGAMAVCDCADHQYRHRTCKHVVAVWLHLQTPEPRS